MQVYFCNLSLSLSLSLFSGRMSAVPEVHASAYQAASPCRGTGQLPAVPSSHTIDLHPGHVSPDIRVTEDEGGNWLGWVQLCSSRNGEEDSRPEGWRLVKKGVGGSRLCFCQDLGRIF